MTQADVTGDFSSWLDEQEKAAHQAIEQAHGEARALLYGEPKPAARRPDGTAVGDEPAVPEPTAPAVAERAQPERAAPERAAPERATTERAVPEHAAPERPAPEPAATEPAMRPVVKAEPAAKAEPATKPRFAPAAEEGRHRGPATTETATDSAGPATDITDAVDPAAVDFGAVDLDDADDVDDAMRPEHRATG